MKNVLVCDLGRSRYADAWRMQHELFEARAEGRIPDVLLLTEHEHVFTLGTTADENHLLARPEELTRRHIDIHKVDRGGDITYHGPGQLVGYPIINLADHYRDTHRYLRDIEEILIDTLLEFGISAGRNPGYTGVWVGENKIAAIGVKISRWVTMHGFALNVSTDLSLFDRIIPCGIFHMGVTSVEEVLGRAVPVSGVSAHFVRHFERVFHLRAEAVSNDELTEILNVRKGRDVCLSSL